MGLPRGPVHRMKRYWRLPRAPRPRARDGTPHIERLVLAVLARVGGAVEAQVQVALPIRQNIGPVGEHITAHALVAPLRKGPEHVLGVDPAALRLTAHVA